MLSTIITKDRLNTFIYSLDDLNKGVFLQGTLFTDLVHKHVDLSLGDTLMSLATSCGLNMNNKGDITEFIQLLKVELSLVRELKITLAFDPDLAFLSRLHSWVSNNISNMRVFDVTVDPSILGGIILVNDGKYLDLSLEKEFNRVFKDISITK